MTVNLLGHEAIAGRFRSTLARGRLASAYLFVGPEGVGKRTFAVWLAERLLCEASAPDELAACGTCESCRLMAVNAHPDLLRVSRPEGKSNLPIELFIGARDERNHAGLCHDISLRPYLGARRVAVIDDADYLAAESANCLLKTLEEPPPGSVLILIGTSYSKQLPTIRSRTQVVRFGPLREDEVSQLLRGMEEIGEDAPKFAPRGSGSVSRALQLADDQLWTFRDSLHKALSGVHISAPRLIEAVVEESNSAGADASSRRERFRTIVGFASDHYRTLLRSEESLASPAVSDSALACLESCLDAEDAVTRNANLTTVATVWVDRLVRCSAR